MKILIYLLTIYVGVLTTVQAQAVETDLSACGPVTFNELKRAGKLFVFEVASVCRLEPVGKLDLLVRYNKSIGDRETVTVLSAKTTENSSARRQAALSIVEHLSTKHGDMTIHGDITIIQSSDTPLRYKHTTSRISATGAAANTRSVIEAADLVVEDNVYRVKISKTLHIKKPWYAPGGIFRTEVGKGLRNDMKVILHRHLGVLSGK